jgi:2-polyprenyl-3-methyl-5-hydroxy-6-metoxy-1,4-benzoquinol methylase
MSLADTDKEWEHFGRTDPYWGVLTTERFRRENLTDEAREEFFTSGRRNVRHFLHAIRRCVAPGFEPARARALDFGCGVGRLTLALAEECESVVGVDVSDSMLAEAQRNVDARRLAHVRLVQVDDQLSQLDGEFDLIVSYIVLQHVPPQRGQEIFQKLVGRLAPGGVGAVHVTYSNAIFDDCPAYFWPPSSPFLSNTVKQIARQFWPPLRTVLSRRWRRDAAQETSPQVRMFQYTLNPLLHVLQMAGVRNMHVEFTNHDGDYGAMLYFQRTSEGYRI